MPRVNIRERDFSTRLTGSSPIIGAMVLPANKGPLEPTLITSDDELLRVYTANEKVEIGASPAFYSMLEFFRHADRAYIVRAQNDALYSGLVLKAGTASSANYALVSGLSDPSAYMFDSTPDVAGVPMVSRITVTDAASLDGTAFIAQDEVGSVGVWFDVDNTGTAIPAAASSADRAIKIDSLLNSDLATDVASKVALALASDPAFASAVVDNSIDVIVTDAAEGSRPDFVDSDSGFLFSTVTQGVDEVSSDDEAALIYESNPGQWGNEFGVKVFNYANSPEIVKEPGASLIQVFRSSNQNAVLESHLVSRNPNALDADGNSIFIETVLEASQYITAISNPVVALSEQLLEQPTFLAMGGGDDGLAVTDVQMLAALEKFENVNEIAISAIMDGGNATPNYQLALLQLCESRGDCKAFLSVPFSVEASADPLAAVIAYRNTTLNVSSSWGRIDTSYVKVFDKFNNRDIFVSPDGLAAGRWAAVTDNENSWFPIAGEERGQVIVKGLHVTWNDEQIEALNEAGINPIKSIVGSGFYIFGNRTLLSRPSKLQNDHVRSLLVYLRPRIKRQAERFQFLVNDEVNRARFEGIVTRIFETVQSGRGVEEFSVKCDAENNPPSVRAQQKMVLYAVFSPFDIAEDIEVTLAVSNSGAVQLDIQAL